MGVKARDVHKLFKQALVSRRYLTEDLARVLWKKCEEAARSEFMSSFCKSEPADTGVGSAERRNTRTILRRRSSCIFQRDKRDFEAAVARVQGAI